MLFKKSGTTKLISVILVTARGDYPMVGLPQVHLLEPTLESLKRQTFKDFELIVIDGLYDQRPDLFTTGKFRAGQWPFPVKHIPVERNEKFNHRFWAQHRRWNVCGALNTGIIHARGELLVRTDDCSEFGQEYLQKFWDGYQKGYWPGAMHIRYLGGRPARLNEEYLKTGYEANYVFQFELDRHEVLKKLYGKDGFIGDTRYPIVQKEGGRKIGPPEWFYGFSSMPLEAALKVNGFNELFDGDKSLEDCDMGNRLWMAGYKNKFLLDVNHMLIEHEHNLPPQSLVDPLAKPIKCNYAIYLLAQQKKRWKGNVKSLSREDIDFIRRHSLMAPCTPAGCSHLYEDDCHGPLFDLWLNRQSTFDLRKERKLYNP